MVGYLEESIATCASISTELLQRCKASYRIQITHCMSACSSSHFELHDAHLKQRRDFKSRGYSGWLVQGCVSPEYPSWF